MRNHSSPHPPILFFHFMELRENKKTQMTNSFNLKEEIIKAIESNNGIKAVSLVMKLMERHWDKFDNDAYHAAVEELIRENEIIELEYTEFDSESYRIKSMYFSKGTKFANLSELNRENSIGKAKTNMDRKSR